jgi:hypothetical protein
MPSLANITGCGTGLMKGGTTIIDKVGLGFRNVDESPE